MTIYEKLAHVQQEMKAPKNLYNSFGKYRYRNAEGILEAFKPYAAKYGLALIVGDEVVEIGGRVYVKATAALYDTEKAAGPVGNTAYAREDAEKKGMDGSQITGAASSYARKYALNGLFLLDDTKDADTDEYTTGRRPEAKTITPEQKAAITKELNRTGVNRKSLCNTCGVGSLDELTERDAADCLEKLAKYPDRKA